MKRLIAICLGLICLALLVWHLPSWSDAPKTPPVGLPVTYSGTTDSNGILTFTYPNAYVVAPNVQATFTNQSGSNQFFRVQSVTTSTITIYAYQRGILNVALVGDVLAGATTPITGATFDLLVTSKQ